MLCKLTASCQLVNPIKKGTLYCYDIDGIKEVLKQEVKVQQIDSMYSDCQEEVEYWQIGYQKMRESANAKDSSFMVQKEQLKEKDLQLEAVQEYSLAIKKQLQREKQFRTGFLIGGSISIGVNVALLTYIILKK